MIAISPIFEGKDLITSPPRFLPGDVVRHLRYGYRGVVVAIDAYCKATPEWYMSNQTQPDRNQPWYHLLIHGSQGTSYPAEENLILDTSGREVIHPQLKIYFTTFENGRYKRNDVPWIR